MSGPSHGPRDGPHDEAHAVPVVGVGASAGGLEALGLLLGGMPADTGMAFVLIQHLAPAHESLLPEILRKRTQLPIEEARDGVRLEANHVYVVAAGTEILLVDGRLSVIPRDSKATVDLFLSTLARVRKEHAIGVVLSGTGSDGTAGAVAIHDQGGLVFAQDPRTTSHDGMPASAIASGAVDMILAPEDIGRELARIARHAFVRLPAASDGEALRSPLDRPGLDLVLAALESATGVSFADYKPNTILRRTMRRMAIHSIDEMARYAELVRTRPAESEALFSDVLIHVTSFFRDPEVFDVLKHDVFPAMLEQRPAGEAVKIWVPGCASGEEAFSVAIAFSEYLESVRSRTAYQVFATDLDGAQITRARAAQFPATLATDLSADRLNRFFVRTPGGYRVGAEIRDRCVFARHNLLGDPPFSRTDLVSCRNVMIYFNSAAQRRLIPNFHYALNPGGFLLLGASEGIGAFSDLFSTLDEKHKIFRRLGVHGSYHGHTVGQTRESRVPVLGLPSGADLARGPSTVQRRTDEYLANKFAPPAVVIRADLSIVQFRGDTSAYLAPAPGAASLNILRMARPGLEVGLRGAIAEAKKKQRSVRREGLWIQEGEIARSVSVEVDPVPASGLDAGYLVVLFEPAAPTTETAEGSAARTDTAPGPPPRLSNRAFSIRRIDELERELTATRSQFQGIVTDRDEANELLQVVNEEAVSANEELQSINEELATAKEELQSTNEELTTLNDELRTRNVDLARLGDELTHLLAGIGAPVVVVDAALVVHRVSAGAEDVFQGRPPRIGTPLAENVAPFNFVRVESEMKRLLGLGLPSTIPIPRRDSRRFLIRVQPYRRGDGVVDGAVLVIVDVEDLERNVAERTSALQASNDQMVMFSHSVSHDLRAPIRAMHGYAEALLDEDGPELGAVRRRYGMQIIEAAARLDGLVLGLLSFSRIRNIDLVMEPVSLHALVPECVANMRAELDECRATVDVEVPASLPDVGAQPVTLTQVIVNVIANAIKFVSTDIRPHVRIHAEERGDVVRLWVEDNGIGILPAHRERIFRVFERLHPNHTYSGVGIGLAFAKQALVRMGGEIGVESIEAGGSRFWIDLPTEASRQRAGTAAALDVAPAR